MRSLVYLAVMLCLILSIGWNMRSTSLFHYAAENQTFAVGLSTRQTQEQNVSENVETTTAGAITSLPLAPSAFRRASQKAFHLVTNDATNLAVHKNRTKFDLSTWTKQTTGGLAAPDRIMIGDIYHKAESVFEFGLGESTYIASAVGVPRYSGVDSDALWIDAARRNSSDHFRFYLGDVGATGEWGMPQRELSKQAYGYHVAPLESEPLPFDVYMVDGRWRVACVMMSFLHASARGATTHQTIVLLHDCNRAEDSSLHRLLDNVASAGTLCQFQRKPGTTDEQLLDLYLEYWKMLA